MSFPKAIGFSLLLHSVFISFFALKLVFFPEENLEFLPAVRVDLVALPDKMTPNQDLVAAASQAKSEAPPVTSPAPPVTAPPVPVPTSPSLAEKIPDVKKLPDLPSSKSDKSRDKAIAALDKIKKMTAMDKIRDSLARDKAAQALSEAEKSKESGVQVKYKGNILAAGSELTGINKLQHDSYLVQLDRHVKKHWSLPEWLMNRELKAKVLVKIGSKGEVLSAQLVKASGNSEYDDLAVETVKKASPFPEPPPKFTSIVEMTGILLGFPE